MTRPTYRYLFPMWEGGGTIPPHLGLARGLLDAGHEVLVIADPTVEDDALAAGCGFAPWSRAPHRTTLDPSEDLLRDWEVANPLTMLKRVRDVFVAGPAADYAADTLEAIDAFDPHALVPDFMLFGTMIAAEKAGVPVAAVVPNIWMIPTKGAPAIGPGFPPARSRLAKMRDALMLGMANRIFDAGLPTLNAARAQFGLAPLDSFYDQVLSQQRILVLTSPTFDFASKVVPGNVEYVGPILDDPSWAETWTSPWLEDDDDPLILVAFSSTYQDQGPVLRRIVEALAGLPVKAIVTLGQMIDASEVPGASNVEVVQSAPHGPILERCSLVVTHCGHGTTMKALAAGVPLVCVPMGRDQNDTAARVVDRGVGVRLSPGSSARDFATAIRGVLEEEGFRSRAQQLSETIEREIAESDVVGTLESVANSRTASTA